MQDLLIDIFGKGKELTAAQVCARSLIMFLTALLLIRFGGVRIFGKKSSFDEIIIIMLGAILSRGVTGSVPFGTAVAGGAMMIAVHKLLAIGCIHSKKLAAFVEGRPVLLFSEGSIIEHNLARCSLSRDEFMESLRLSTNQTNLDCVEKAYMENNGSISFILKEK